MLDARYSMRSHVSGALSSRRRRRARFARRMGRQAPRSRRPHLRRPARPHRHRPVRLRPRRFGGGVRHRRAGAARVGRRARRRRFADARTGTENPSDADRRGRGHHRHGARAQPQRDAAVRDRGGHRHRRAHPDEVALSRHPPAEVFAALQLRDRVTQRFRKSLEHRGFMEVETPILGRRPRRRALATSSCRAGSTRASSTRCRSPRSSSSSC